jgi:hypothetical protein
MRTLLLALLIPSIGYCQTLLPEDDNDYKPDLVEQVLGPTSPYRFLPKDSEIVAVEREVPDIPRRLMGDKDATKRVLRVYREDDTSKSAGTKLIEQVLGW